MGRILVASYNLALRYMGPMRRSGGKSIAKLLLCGAILMAIALGLVWRFSVLAAHTSIRDLQEVPLQARVRLAGVVTYVDFSGHRVWIQDESGAIPLDLDPGRVRDGQTISVTAIKTHRYDPAEGPVSVGLKEVKLIPGMARVKLPAPVPVSGSNFPTQDKNGIQVVASGVVRTARKDAQGRGELIITDGGFTQTFTMRNPSPNYLQLVNANVRAVGVPEFKSHPAAGEPDRRVWISSQEKLQVIRPSPPDRVFNIRSFYLDPDSRSGHRIRIRGRVVPSMVPNAIGVEDAHGTMECQLSEPTSIPPGTPVEVVGFPAWEAHQARLTAASVHAIPQSDFQPGRDGNETGLPLLTRVRDIRNLSPEEARRAYPVKLNGVISYIDNLWTQAYVQDETGGIYLKLATAISATAGSHVEISGFTDPGDFAPIIIAPQVRIIGRAELPQPVEMSAALAQSGRADSQFVTVEGIVHPVKTGENPYHPIVTFELLTDFGQVHVYTSPTFPDLEHAQRYEDARVRLRGVFGSIFNSRRQLVGYQLLVQNTSDVSVLEPPAGDVIGAQPTPIAELLRFSSHNRFGHRVRVAGVVTLAQPNRIYLQDSTGGVEVHSASTFIHLGDSIEASGYPTLAGRYSPVMTDAILRPSGSAPAPIPRASTAEEMLTGAADGTLVSVEARLRTILNEPSLSTLVLQSGVHTFIAKLDTSDRGEALRDLREGSVVRLTGVCFTQIDPNKIYTVIEQRPASFEILLRSPKDVAVLRAAPFWTTQNTLALLAVFALVLPGVIVWVLILRRRVQLQTAALQKAAETAQAVRDLSDSMQTVTREKRFDTQVSVRGSEDIAQLVVGFNDMLSELQNRERDKLAAEGKLKRIAMIDELTQIPNRRMLYDRLSQTMARAIRHHEKLAILYLDLDGFKAVNDNLGHNMGDLLLIQVAQRLRSHSRISDTLARIGGDEFVVMLENVRSYQDVEAAAQNLLAAFDQPFQLEERSLRVGASVGVALYPDHASDGETLLQFADFSMYAAKKNGKNQIVFFGDNLGNAARERLTLEGELRRAVAENSLTAHYQPEFDLVSGRVVRFEALARWIHPQLGIISPAQFIPIAEESGLIVPLGAAILRRACQDAVSWNLRTGLEIPVAVNVSNVQFARDSFITEVAEILRETGLRPDLLQLELTESATLTGIDRSSALIQKFKDMCVSVALDDFGTGYSCLSYLPRLPFDAIKIDRSFVHERLSDPDSIAFVRSVVNMAHNLGMRVIVEGIETEEELSIFSYLGGDEAQGYLLGRPGPDPLDVLMTDGGTSRYIASRMLDLNAAD